MEIFSTIIILIAVLALLSFLYDKNKRDQDWSENVMKTFEQTFSEVFESLEKTNNKFYEMASRIETEHFLQLEKQTEKSVRSFDKNIDKLLKLLEEKKVSEKISSIDSGEKNSIEREEEVVDPLSEFDPSTIRNIKNIQFEGEESIYPISNE